MVTGPRVEFNEIAAGGTDGWLAASGCPRDPRDHDRLIGSGGTIGKPSGIVECRDPLHVAGLLGRQLVRIRLAPSAAMPLPNQFEDPWGRLRDVVVGPDGAPCVGTSNRDGRRTPDPADDRILRVRP